jgi:hypothetical protein
LVVITGGKMSAIKLGSKSGALTATGLISGTVVVPPGGYISLAYSVAPSWAWYGL